MNFKEGRKRRYHEGKKKTKRIVTAKAETRREVEELAKMATSEDTAYIETTTTEAHEAAQELKTDVYRKGEEVKRKIKKLNGDICSSGEIHVK